MSSELRDIDRRITELSHESINFHKSKPFGALDYIGLGIVAIIVAGTVWACVHAYQEEREAANAPKAEQPMPPGYRYIDMPNGQPDVITFCDLGNRVYRDAYGHTGETIAVVPNDPSCAGS